MSLDKVQMPPKIYLTLRKGDFRAMPVYSSIGRECAGIKWVSVFPYNKKHGLPSVIATILLSNINTGELLALIEANALTAYRTGSAGALASKYLGNPNAKTLTLVGAGTQSEYQLQCHLDLFEFNKVCVWSPEEKEINIFVNKLKPVCPVLSGESNLEKCVKESDIIVTCTPSRKPIIKTHWVRPGTHISAMGADAKGKQELEGSLLKVSSVFVDDWNQASHSGEINVPLSKKQITRKHVKGTFTEALKKYKRNKNDITIFDSTGLAIQDIALAEFLYKNVSS
jgi:alanine dehydrogenase